MRYAVIDGNLFDQRVEAIVNPWNRNVIPWWLLLPQGVSDELKRRAGLAPFRELAKLGPIPLGGAVLTSAGRLPHRAIVHVAGIDMLWRASVGSVRRSTVSAVELARGHGFQSLAMPLIGAGSGSLDESIARETIEHALGDFECDDVVVTVVRFAPGKA